MAPATAPANIECHRRVFLRTQTWCTCAEDDNRASRLSPGDICIGSDRADGGEGGEDEAGESSKTKPSRSS